MQREIIWERADGVGTEHLRVAFEDGVRAAGVAVGVDDAPFSVSYRIRCDESERVRSIRVERCDGTDSLELEHDGDGTWTDGDGDPIPELARCLDLDVAVTPFTNTIPIRRLGLPGGESRDLRVAYVDASRMSVRAADQRYTCLSELDADGGRFRYENTASGFTAEIPVDADGVVRDYPGLFRRAFP
ncbi:putative glycolipid-binding domain-containing protein [Halalkalicoccus sp. NIPERK01]|uniref:putative glycolipid-binding domain-containing protein n=1 Tax=Halalkalicoccus sp. NIPERK01 TaxID=3053469 RepID=UPI00256EECD0|nr:putative glycolipid-binding domain-containing protein [Halalkalicoccus sp. NIPERK01]MDL5363008.1 putative glycolipid-binding domain-containing protein [Halalkalicoccus sp. NIPERK01]